MKTGLQRADAGGVLLRFSGTPAVMQCHGLAPRDVELLRRRFFLTVGAGGGMPLEGGENLVLLTRFEGNQAPARPTGDAQEWRPDESLPWPKDPTWLPSLDRDRLAWGTAEVCFDPSGPTRARIEATGAHRWALLPTAFAACASRALAAQGVALLHAASFVAGERCVLVAGPRCAGKSTVAAAALAASWGVLSDDSVLCWLDRGVPTLAPFRRFLSFREKTLTALPPPIRGSLRRFRGHDEERWLWEVPAPKTGRGYRIAALWLARVDENAGDSVIEPLDDARALAGLLNSVSVLFMTAKYPEEAAALTRVLVATVERTPSFEVVLGRDVLLQPRDTLRRLTEVTL